jgi:hypothetical protein
MREAEAAPKAKQLLLGSPSIAHLMTGLSLVLHGLWLSEYSWQSLEVFVPIYNLLCEMMALHGMAFTRQGDEWRAVMTDEVGNSDARMSEIRQQSLPRT